MKKQCVVLFSLFLALVFSCRSAAGRSDVLPGPADPSAQTNILPPIPALENDGEGEGREPPVSEPDAPVDEAPPVDEIPSETPFAGEPALVDIGDLPEPFVDLPETEAEENPPGEAVFAAALPEPAAPNLPEALVSPDSLAQEPELPPLPEPPVPEPPVVQPPPLAVSPPQPVQPPAPVPPVEQPPAPEPPAQVIPSPPPFIRPAEEAPEPAPVRTPVPMPPAEPPAWTRQNQAEARPVAPPPQAAPVEPRPSPALPASPAEPPVPDDGDINFSRTVRATVGQLVEIPFRGTGWVYLGEMGSRQGLAYGSRRLDPEGQSFIFRAEAAGTYSLKFYKQDFVRDYILNDYVQVIVGESPEAVATGWFNPATDRGRAIAEPRWPTVAEEAEAFRNSGGTGAGRANPEPGPVQSTARPDQPAAPVPGPVQSAARPDQPAPPVPLADSALAESARAGPVAAGSVSADGSLAASPAGQTAAGRETPPRASPPPAPAAAPLPAIEAPPPPAAEPPASPELGSLASPAETVADLPEGAPDQYLRRAREEFEAGRVAPALALLDQFRERYPAGSDETWWLYGQFYEANSPSRDIRSSLDYYRRLLREYPQSSRCNEARRRIAYLERYYINIR